MTVTDMSVAPVLISDPLTNDLERDWALALRLARENFAFHNTCPRRRTFSAASSFR